MAAIISVLITVGLLVLCVAAVRRRSHVVALVALVGLTVAITGCGSSDSSSSTTTQDSSQSDAAPAPTPTPKPVSRQELKHEFLQTVDESISGALIAGAPFKYVGKHVDLHCTVADIPQEDFFNATCGEDSDGMPVNIVVVANSRELSQGQAVRVIGTVAEPMEGTNAMGGDTHFPTVNAEFME